MAILTGGAATIPATIPDIGRLITLRRDHPIPVIVPLIIRPAGGVLRIRDTARNQRHYLRHVPQHCQQLVLRLPGQARFRHLHLGLLRQLQLRSPAPRSFVDIRKPARRKPPQPPVRMPFPVREEAVHKACVAIRAWALRENVADGRLSRF